ncbi:reverse transcriptase domain-containing protein [Tanacetum coccineum]
MSTHEQQTSTIPTSVVWNTRGKSGPQNLEEPASNETLRELCDKNYHQLFPLIAEKMQKEKEQQDKLKAVKAHLLYGDESGRNPRNHEESCYSESKTPTARTKPIRRHGQNHSRSPSPVASVFRRLEQNRVPSPRLRPRKEGGVFNRLGRKEPGASTCFDSHHQSSQAKGTEVLARKHHHEGTPSRRTSGYSEREDSEGGHWKSKSKRHRPDTYEDDLSRPWTCEESNPFTTWIRHFDFPRTRMPSHVKTYDGSGDPKNDIKLFQSAAKTDRWAMPTWCHMENYHQQTKHIKDPVETHHIKQRDEESTEDFMERYIEEVLDGNYVFSTRGSCRIQSWPEESTHAMEATRMGKQTELQKGFQKQVHRSDRKSDRFSLLTRTPKEIFAFKKESSRLPPPMVTSCEKKDPNKSTKNSMRRRSHTDKCMQLRKQIDEMIKAGKLSQFIKELKQNDKPKAPKKGETAEKERPLAILMIQTWEKVVKQKVTQSFSLETTISFPPLGDEDETEGPMIIEAEIGGHFVHRMYLDGGTYPHRKHLIRTPCSSWVRPEKEVKWFAYHILNRIQWGNHLAAGPDIIASEIRPGIRKIRVIPSTAHGMLTHGMLKFPVEGGTVTLRSSRIIPMECAMISGPSTRPPEAGKILEEKIRVAIHPEYPEQTIAIGSTLTEKGRKELCTLLGQNLDVFAWKPADMTGVPRSIAEHCLNIREGCPPVRQKKRGQAPERNKAIQEEVEKLVDAGIMKEVHYHSWLSNPVMVKKHDGTWRMCVDFKDLNNACPKDCYPLPEIDWKIESLCGYPFKCFLDAYKGYHQIKMAKEDEEKTAFITNQGIFCYSKMPFGLKMPERPISDCRTEEESIRDIAETFKTLRQINMKLNPKKCSFEMQEGMFLGYKVNTDRLKVCSDKAGTVLSLPSPRCLKDVQKLNGKLASLNMFLSKSAERSLPFFKTLKKCTKKSDFQLTQEAEAAFKQMKKLIAELTMLTTPKEKEELIVYLVAAKEAISAVLMTDREGKQVPVYFVSRALRGPEINYTP